MEKKLNLNDFKKAVTDCIDAGLSNHAPLGSSGNHIILSGNFDPIISRVSQVSVRLHNTQVELLCTNKQGSFIYYGKYHKNLGVEFIAAEHFRVYEKIFDCLFQDIIKKITS